MCPQCRKKLTRIVRLTDDERLETRTEVEICENQACSLYINTRRVRNWIPRERLHEA